MIKFTNAIKSLTWILVIAIGVLTVLSPSLFIVRQVSSWTISPDWTVSDDWTIGSTPILTFIAVDGVLEVLKKAVEVLSRGEVAMPVFVLGLLILNQIYKRRDTMLRFNQ